MKFVCAHRIVRRVAAVEESDARLRAGRLAFRREDIPGHSSGWRNESAGGELAHGIVPELKPESSGAMERVGVGAQVRLAGGPWWRLVPGIEEVRALKVVLRPCKHPSSEAHDRSQQFAQWFRQQQSRG